MDQDKKDAIYQIQIKEMKNDKNSFWKQCK